MGILRRWLGGGSTVPVDPAQGDEQARTLREELATGRFDGTRQWMRRCTRSADRQFYATALTEPPVALEVFMRWAEDHPDDANAHLLLGVSATLWAWEARGSGTGDRVSEEAAQQFFNLLNLAAHHLQQAAKRAPTDGTPLAALITVAKGLNEPPKTAARLFERAVKVRPLHVGVHLAMLSRLCEKWGGSHEQMFAFARKRARAAPEGHELHVLIPMAHTERWLFGVGFARERSAQQYFTQPDVQQEVRDAHARSLGSPAHQSSRLSVLIRNHFAFAFYQMGEHDLARREFEQLGDRVTVLPWTLLDEPGRAFADARQAVGG